MRSIRAFTALALMTVAVMALGSKAVGAAPQSTLIPAGLFGNDHFGVSVDMDGDTLVVGAFQGNHGSPLDPGAAYVYVRNGTSWVPQQKLFASDGEDFDEFGFSVAISADTIVVGAPGEVNTGANDKGAIYVFHRQGAIWSEQAKLFSPFGPNPTLNGRLGTSVDIEGDVIVAGAPFEPAPSARGSAYVFGRSGTTWTATHILLPFDCSTNCHFGLDVAIEGETILVGSPGKWPSPGYVYPFMRSGTSWVNPGVKFTSSTSIPGEGFGTSLAMRAGLAVVGSPGIEKAFVFSGSKLAWSETKRLDPVGLTPGAGYGLAVDVQQDEILVAAPLESSVHPNAGMVMHYRWDGSSWQVKTIRRAPTPTKDAGFGISVAIDGGWILVGEPGFPMIPRAGAAYACPTDPQPTVYCTAKPNSCGGLPAIGAFGTPSATSGSGFTVSCAGARGKKAGLLLYTDSGRQAIPFNNGLLCVNVFQLKRSTAVVDTMGTAGQCNGTLSIDMNAFAVGALGGSPLASLTTLGMRINCQFWARDTVANGALLSDALEYYVEP